METPISMKSLCFWVFQGFPDRFQRCASSFVSQRSLAQDRPCACAALAELTGGDVGRSSIGNLIKPGIWPISTVTLGFYRQTWCFKQQNVGFKAIKLFWRQENPILKIHKQHHSRIVGALGPPVYASILIMCERNHHFSWVHPPQEYHFNILMFISR